MQKLQINIWISQKFEINNKLTNKSKLLSLQILSLMDMNQ